MKTMKKMLIASIGCIFLSVASCAMDNARMSEKGPAKTIKLPSGEVVHDLNGEWDALLTYPGFQFVKPYKQIIKIIQKGKFFEGILMMDDQWASKGYRLIEGGLSNGNFGYVRLILIPQTYNASGQISEDGKRIVLEADSEGSSSGIYGKIARFTLTRK